MCNGLKSFIALDFRFTKSHGQGHTVIFFMQKYNTLKSPFLINRIILIFILRIRYICRIIRNGKPGMVRLFRISDWFTFSILVMLS